MVLFASFPSAAQPRLRVRAETRLELAQERVDSGVHLRGALLDDLGLPLASRELDIEVQPADDPAALVRERLRTDREGRFSLDVPLASHRTVRLRAIFSGDENHERLEVERVIDTRRADVRLRLQVDDVTLPLDRATHRVMAHATSTAGGHALALTLEDELGRPLARGTTDTAGQAAFELSSRALGGPGAGRLVLRTDGDETRFAGRSETPVVRTRASELVLEAPSHVAAGGHARLYGRLNDALGPLPERTIGFFVGEAHRGSTLTRTDGSFEWRLDTTRADAPKLDVVARYESDEPGRLPTRSSPRTIHVEVPAPMTVWAWVAVVLCALAAWLARSLGRNEGTAAVGSSHGDPAPIVLAPRRSERSSTISGRLEDRDGRSLAGRVTAHGADGVSQSVEVVAGVPFELALPRGSHALEFEARGHASHRVVVMLPHRGQWTGATVRLESWRWRALLVLRETVARARLSSPERATVREAVALGDPAMRALGSEVERALYDRDMPDEATIAALEELATEAVRCPSARTR